MAGNIWLIRHGETSWSRDLLHTGRTDVPLTEIGEQQARITGQRLTDITPSLVICSPLTRSRRTAELAGLQPDSYSDDLLEWDYGAWEGRTTKEIRVELDDPNWVVWQHLIPPGNTPGEQLTDVADRVTRVIDKCLSEVLAGRDCVLIAHGHVLRLLTATWLGLPPIAGRLFALDPACLSALGFEHEQKVIKKWNT